MDVILLIEIAGSTIYVIQKFLLSEERRIGWIFGIVGAMGFATVTLSKGAYAYFILEVISGVMFLIGYIAWGKYEGIQTRTTIFLSILAILGVCWVLYFNLGSPNYVLEISMVVMFSIGAIFLVLKHKIGWVLYGIGHIILVIFALQIETYFILVLQIVSLYFAVQGYKNFPSKPKETISFRA